MKSYHFHRFVIFVLISLTELLDNLYNECVFSLEDEVLNPRVELDVEGIKGKPMMMHAIYQTKFQLAILVLLLVSILMLWRCAGTY